MSTESHVICDLPFSGYVYFVETSQRPQYSTATGICSMLKATSRSKGRETKKSGTTFHTEQCQAEKDPYRIQNASLILDPSILSSPVVR